MITFDASHRMVDGRRVRQAAFPTPHALPNLMKHIQANTKLNVQFARQSVRLDAADVFNHPILYMTGLRDFKLTDAEVANLKAYLNAGGVLIADAAAGRKAFDVAFRREVARVVGDGKFVALASDPPLFTMPYAIGAVELSPVLAATVGDRARPALEAVTLDGRLAVIYSPFSLSNGWEQLPYPYNRGYADADAIRLGVNIIAYGMMH